LIAVPGPDWAFVLAAGLRDRAVLPAVGGLVVGYVLLTVLVAAGLGPLFASMPAALAALTVVGAGYLIYLGVVTLRSSGERDGLPVASVASVAPPGTRRRLVRRGIGVSALNPKALLFFVAFLPQFTRPGDAWPLPVQLAVLGGVWALIIAVFYTAVGYAA